MKLSLQEALHLRMLNTLPPVQDMKDAFTFTSFLRILIHTGWQRICNINGTVALVDISTDNMSEVKKNLNKSMKEQVGRKIGARDFAELYDADKRLDEMKRMYDEIKSYNEVIKLVHIRIFLARQKF